MPPPARQQFTRPILPPLPAAAKVISDLARLLPREVCGQMSFLLPYLGCHAYPVRSELITVMGTILIQPQAFSRGGEGEEGQEGGVQEENDVAARKRRRTQGHLQKELLARFMDKNALVRCATPARCPRAAAPQLHPALLCCTAQAPQAQVIFANIIRAGGRRPRGGTARRGPPGAAGTMQIPAQARRSLLSAGMSGAGQQAISGCTAPVPVPSAAHLLLSLIA